LNSKIITTILILILFNPIILGNNTPIYMTYGDHAAKGTTDIINESRILYDSIVIPSGSSLEIRDSVLDFTHLTDKSIMIENYGHLNIVNTTIITDLRLNHSVVISSFGNLSVSISNIVNIKYPIDLSTGATLVTSAITQDGGELSLFSNYFENYTTGIINSNSKVTKLYGNLIKNCSRGFETQNTNDFGIEYNTFINSFVHAIDGYGINITVIGNLIYNDLALLMGNSSINLETKQVTIGIGLTGNYNNFLNNIVFNTFKGLYTYSSNHTRIENNIFKTSRGIEGELQLQSVFYSEIRNNTFVNQWDPIEIYNSKHIVIEDNIIKDASSGIRVEIVDYLKYAQPENYTIRNNILINAPYTAFSHCKNILITQNVFNNTEIKIKDGSEFVTFSNNILIMSEITVENTKNVSITENIITSRSWGIMNNGNNVNLVVENNTIKGFGGLLPIPEQFATIPTLYLIIGFIAFFGIIAFVLIHIIIKKVRK